MAHTFRDAATTEAKPLVGLYAESGAGKTYSALLLAKGFAGDMTQVGMIETESGRGEAWADHPVVGGYKVLPLRQDFSPKTYGAAIKAAEDANLKALIVDSASHEWEGVGGVLSMAATNQADGKKGPIVWQKPKMDHAREFMLRLTQTPIPLVIVCMRAKYPMYEVTARDLEAWKAAGSPGKAPKVGEWARSWKLDPKQADDILFEMFVHGWIDHEHRFHGTKYTLEKLREVFIDNEPITVQTGQRLAAWARGRAVTSSAAQTESSAANPPRTQGGEPTGAAEFVSPDQAIDIEDKLKEAGIAKEKLLRAMEKAGITAASISLLPKAAYRRALDWIAAAREARGRDASA